MGVNRIGFGIIDDEVCKEAGKQEIIRRFFRAQMDYASGLCSDECIMRAKAIMDKAGLVPEDRKVVPACKLALDSAISRSLKGNKGTVCAAAIEINDSTIVTAHNSEIMHAGSALILNALKKLSDIDQEINLISPEVIESITRMKRDILTGRGVSLNIDEILICLAMSATNNEYAEKAMNKLPELKGAEVHFSHIPSAGDLIGLRKLGMNVTAEPKFPTKNIYNP